MHLLLLIQVLTGITNFITSVDQIESKKHSIFSLIKITYLPNVGLREAVSYFWWPKKPLFWLFYWDNRLFSTKYLLLVTRSWYDMTQFSFLDTFPIIASIMSLLVHVCLSKCVSHSTHFVLTCAFTKCTSDPLCIMFQTSKVYLDSFLRLRR